MKALPNLLTAARLVLAIAMLVALAAAANAVPGWTVDDAGRLGLQSFAFLAFAVAAITDFFDGWLARRPGRRAWRSPGPAAPR